MHVSKIRCDGKSEKFCKIFLKLNRAKYKSSKQKQKQKMIIECLPACLQRKAKAKPAAQGSGQQQRKNVVAYWRAAVHGMQKQNHSSACSAAPQESTRCPAFHAWTWSWSWRKHDRHGCSFFLSLSHTHTLLLGDFIAAV
jgi:hypothetical protein